MRDGTHPPVHLRRDAKDLIRWQHNTVQAFRSSRTGWRHVVSPNLLLRNTGRIINPALLQRTAPRPKSLVFGFADEDTFEVTPLEARPMYTCFRQLVVENRKFVDVDEYRFAQMQLGKKNKINGYRDITAETYMQTRLALLHSLSQEGLQRDPRWRIRHTGIGVVIERDGELAFCGGGHHRLAFAHAEGLRTAFVDVVGIHHENLSEIDPELMSAGAGITVINRIIDDALVGSGYD